MAKYMLLIFGDPARWGAMTPEQGKAHDAAHAAFVAAAGPGIAASEELTCLAIPINPPQPSSTAWSRPPSAAEAPFHEVCYGCDREGRVARVPCRAVAGSVSGVAGQAPGPGLLWEDLAGSFAVDGSVKTVYIEGAGSMTTWQALADWVCIHGPDYRYAETGTAGPGLPVPAVAEIFARRSRLARPHLQGLSGWIAPGIGAWLVFSQFTPAWFLVSQEDI
jgi:hypothetical protein